MTIVLALVVAYMVAEVGVVGGLLTGSLALLATRATCSRMLVPNARSLRLVAAQRPASARHTYGYYRGEILVALVNSTTLIAVSF